VLSVPGRNTLLCELALPVVEVFDCWRGMHAACWRQLLGREQAMG
jgi:hypothetical protein